MFVSMAIIDSSSYLFPSPLYVNILALDIQFTLSFTLGSQREGANKDGQINISAKVLLIKIEGRN